MENREEEARHGERGTYGLGGDEAENSQFIITRKQSMSSNSIK